MVNFREQEQIYERDYLFLHKYDGFRLSFLAPILSIPVGGRTFSH